MNKIKFFAQEASYYSAIVRPMLRYKCIPFKETTYGGKIFSRFFEKSGSVQLPQIETPDGEVENTFTESTDLNLGLGYKSDNFIS